MGQGVSKDAGQQLGTWRSDVGGASVLRIAGPSEAGNLLDKSNHLTPISLRELLA